MNIYHLLGQHAHWQVNKQLARYVGIEAALFLSDLISKRQYFIEHGDLIDGWFYNTQANIELDTSLSDFQQRKAISNLTEKGFLSVQKKGVPARHFFLIHDDLLLNYLTTSALKSEALDLEKVKHINKNKGIRTKNKNKEESLYQSAIDFWLKEFHSGWDFGAVQGTKLKSILNKLKKRLTDTNRPETDSDILNAFKQLCLNLPPYYQDKDLQVIDSKLNEIIAEIKKKKGAPQVMPSDPSKEFEKDVIYPTKEGTFYWLNGQKIPAHHIPHYSNNPKYKMFKP